jgi:hypothetical protein
MEIAKFGVNQQNQKKKKKIIEKSEIKITKLTA